MASEVISPLVSVDEKSVLVRSCNVKECVFRIYESCGKSHSRRIVIRVYAGICAYTNVRTNSVLFSYYSLFKGRSYDKYRSNALDVRSCAKRSGLCGITLDFWTMGPGPGWGTYIMSYVRRYC